MNYKIGTQKANILAHLLTGATLSCEQCRDNKWGSNLVQRVHNLKNEGYYIGSNQINDGGGSYHFEYYLTPGYFIQMIQTISGYRVNDIESIFKDIHDQYEFNEDGDIKHLAGVLRDIKGDYMALTF